MDQVRDRPLVSICVPAYKKPSYVTRLLDSVIRQTYKRVEVVVSDDTPDDSVKIAIEPYINQLDIKYYHNAPALKSPVNWNNALDKASGELVQLLHQDDWLEREETLQVYVDTFSANPDADFVFCRNTALEEGRDPLILQALPGLLRDMARRPNHLLRANVIGPPSNTMLRARVDTRYDERYIWLVDVDYYVRLLKSGFKYVYLDRHLVTIGLHADQTTAFVRANDNIILKENIWYARKLEADAFSDVLIYDYYWRLLRNHGVRNLRDITDSGVEDGEIRPVIRHMLKGQQLLPLKAWKRGAVSKSGMMLSYWTRGRDI
jgi:glycosyltransferase involved in cell wall biosynthesis